MTATIGSATAEDPTECGRITRGAFAAIADQHAARGLLGDDASEHGAPAEAAAV